MQPPLSKTSYNLLEAFASLWVKDAGSFECEMGFSSFSIIVIDLDCFPRGKCT